MNTVEVQLGAGTASETSDIETSDSETSEPGSPAAARWAGVLTNARVSAADPASSQNQISAGWVAEEGQAEGENRQEAVSRTSDWREDGDVNGRLDLSSLSLTALPVPLPAGLRRLYAVNNRLSSLPANLPSRLRRLMVDNNQLTHLPALPATLRELDASGNRLTSLPDLPTRLQRLNVDYNQLTNLPQPLPAELEWLSASHNELTSLPETFPAEILWLGASNNQLTSVPETLLTQLGRESSVDLEHNPLPEPLVTNLSTATHRWDYVGPQIFLSMDEGAEEVEPRPLHEVVADWLEGEPAAVAAWQRVALQPGAQNYALFLDRLRASVNYSNDSFRQAVVEDLRQAVARPPLREQFFELASDASMSCEDRITLTWNRMQTARLNADVEDGAYDGRLDELLQHGRVMFRLEALDGIARRTVESLRLANPDADIDEIEVYLAYQTQLREQLELRHIAPDMRFLSVSHVTEDDIARAETSVRSQEATGFADYLATSWQPWETVMRRIVPEDHAAMQDRLYEATGEEFQTRLNRGLAERGLIGDLDAERLLGAEIVKEITREIKSEVMHRVLSDRGIEL
ncbi:NEL-type E3 ubiquitin ligase domain-containing protein [Bradyrhizobium sp. BEA-2-5]|uniref:NEL-type E3 ubiquitin ligase domain-containing protein n=1 Tax=Bradyrhizobium sp. BEA-2-5 TaxID=3080015 RepID=UPI00293F0F6D|nr:NEL-type E3 ubiquitin ligase domain-containing protein [Bradyrhizobium sp. BEA-2-5]WOH80242.1 NEL-type E3 ubiquitin ligase domain-containing protein [Bradyrhizobium sp. BEA-2-5]